MFVYMVFARGFWKLSSYFSFFFLLVLDGIIILKQKDLIFKNFVIESEMISFKKLNQFNYMI